MLPKERDKDLILNILDDAETLEKRIRHFNVTEESFINDLSFEGDIVYDSLLMPVYTLVEDALHLSDEVMEFFPDYPWSDVRAFRNIVAHGYRRVSKEIAWKVIFEDIPQLVALLKEYAEENGFINDYLDH